MEISLYFEPVDLDRIQFSKNQQENCIGNTITLLQDSDPEPTGTDFDIAIIGINEDRRSVNNEGCAQGPDEIRKHLYPLFNNNRLRIADLGNIRQGLEVKDTYFAVKSVVAGMLEANVVPLVIGGGQDLTWPIYMAFESLGRIINMVSVDSKFDHGNSDEMIDSESYLSKIILRKPNFLFNYANLGYQSYFVDPKAINLFKSLFFDVHRLGIVRQNLEEAEPVIRNADFLTFDISSIRQSDAPGNANASPNGFYGEEVCQLLRYTGMSNKLSCAGFFEFNPHYDSHGQTAKLLAQMIWYFLEGFDNRCEDFPNEKHPKYIKFIVNVQGINEDLLFYKSKLTDRWWMQLPVSEDNATRLRRHILVPCSYNDYYLATKNEIPDRWWQAYQKLM